MHGEPFALPLPGSSPGEPVSLRGRRYRFGDRGPRVLVTAGVHGNEVNAVGALWELQQCLPRMGLTGTVTVIPCVNTLAVAGKGRRIPCEDTDLNRFFPGNRTGYLAERLAALLIGLLEEHDLLLDVHTTGWCIPHVLLDHTADRDLRWQLLGWASQSGLPLVQEMPDGLASLQGLNRSWSAHALAQGKLALTVELPGFLTLEREVACRGCEVLQKLLRFSSEAATTPSPPAEVWQRLELHGNSSGIFEAHRFPGERLRREEVVGLIRGFEGEEREEVRMPHDGLLLVLQVGSAVCLGAWLATLGTM